MRRSIPTGPLDRISHRDQRSSGSVASTACMHRGEIGNASVLFSPTLTTVYTGVDETTRDFFDTPRTIIYNCANFCARYVTM